MKTRIYLAITLLIVGVIYLLTLTPYVGAGDSGELIVTAYKLAAAHPPGYPLYTLLAHLFTLIPISTIAWRVGLFSVVSQLLCAFVMFDLVKRWLKEEWIAASVTLLFCLAPLTWHHSVEAEVFALNNMFAAILLWIFYRFQSEKSEKWAYIGCAVLGIASCHHLTIVFFSFPFFAALMWQERTVLLKPKVLLIGTFLFLICLTPYLLMFYLGQQRLIIAWGDFSSWDGFFTHVLRAEYGTFRLASPDKANSGFLPKLYHFTREMGIQTFIVGSVLWLWGAIAAFRSSAQAARFARLATGSMLFYVLVFHYLSNLDLSVPLYYYAQSRMWLLPLLLITLTMGFGLYDLKERFKWKYASLAMASLVSLVLIASVAYNWKFLDGSKRDFFARLGHSMIDAVEPNAVILMREDVYVNTLRYLQTVDNVRPDVGVIPVDELWWPWAKALVEANVPNFVIPGNVFRNQIQQQGDFTLRTLLDANVDRRPLYMAKLYAQEEESLRGGFIGFPYGFASRVKREGKDFTLEEIKHETEPFLSLKLPKLSEHRWESWDTFIYKNYYDVRIPMAQVMVKRSGGRVAWLVEAANILKGVATESHEYKPQALDFMGSIYMMLASIDNQYKWLAIQAWREYLASDPPDPKETEHVKQMLRDVVGESL